MSAALSKRILDEFATVHESLPASVVSPEQRKEAIQALAARGLPTTRDENWRYTNLRPLERARFAPVAATAAGSAPTLLLPSASDLPPKLDGFSRYTFVDGAFVPDLSAPLEHAAAIVHNLRRDAQRFAGRGALSANGNSHTDASSAREGFPATVTRLPHALPALNALPEARLALLNEAFAIDTAVIDVGSGAGETPRVELVFVSAAGAEAGASYPRVQVALEPGTRLTLVERHISVGGGANFVNSSVQVDIGRGANLTHFRLQQAGARATWLDTLSATLAADARYRLLTVNTGGLSARSTTYVQMAGAGAELTLSAAALGDRQQVQDNFALVEHIAPRARTEQTFRGIASGRARVAFNGKIAVREAATGTDSRQSLRGLLAGPEAEIDVRPQLEIYTDEVRCSHGATAGKLDDNMLFYLLTRGLAPEVAQRLLKWAFVEDVLSKIEPKELRRQIEHDLAGQVSDAAALKELLS